MTPFAREIVRHHARALDERRAAREALEAELAEVWLTALAVSRIRSAVDGTPLLARAA